MRKEGIVGIIFSAICVSAALGMCGCIDGGEGVSCLM